MDKLPNNLRALRERAGLSPEGLAERIGISAVTIWRHEAGKRDISTKKLKEYAQALGCEPKDIIAENNHFHHEESETISANQALRDRAYLLIRRAEKERRVTLSREHFSELLLRALAEAGREQRHTGEPVIAYSFIERQLGEILAEADKAGARQ